MQELKKYILDTLGISVGLVKWSGKRKLMHLLQDGYDYFQIVLFGQKCLIMHDLDKKEETPAVIKKHIEEVNKYWDGEVIYLRGTISSFNRKRLIDHKISFIVPFNQMYLPLIKIDLREYFKKIRANVKKLSPATQVVVLYALYNGAGPYTPSVLSKILKYSVMTLTRSFDELESADIGEFTNSGRERALKFTAGLRSLWEKSKELMTSPVRKKVFIKMPGKNMHWPLAGLTALSAYSMLDEPRRPVYAIGSEEWRASEHKIVHAEEPGACEVEIWKYSPERFEFSGKVDRFSLILSLRDNSDERVELAIEEMMEKFKW